MSWARWERDYWQSDLREALGRDREAVEAWHWLVAGGQAPSIGVYRVHWRTMATALFLDGAEHARAVLGRLVAVAGPRHLRLDDDWVWVVGAARKQQEPIGSDAERRRRGRGLTEEIAEARKSPFWADFVEQYADHLRLSEAESAVRSTMLNFDRVRSAERASTQVRSAELAAARLQSSSLNSAQSLPIPSHPYPAQPNTSSTRVHAHECNDFAHDQPARHQLSTDGSPAKPESSEAEPLEERARDLADPLAVPVDPAEGALVGALREVVDATAELYSGACRRASGLGRHPRTRLAVARAVLVLADDGRSGAEIGRMLGNLVAYREADAGWRSRGRPKGHGDALQNPDLVFGFEERRRSVSGATIGAPSVLGAALADAERWAAEEVRCRRRDSKWARPTAATSTPRASDGAAALPMDPISDAELSEAIAAAGLEVAAATRRDAYAIAPFDGRWHLGGDAFCVEWLLEDLERHNVRPAVPAGGK